ncbi:putative disease resistance protein RGA3 [Nicotiana tomentosiformis]|uniref:putative disease resistance protein RGA3 n=1 Tax=Nicotiana tomentosiformis TaxID=4098 RepID=UPI00388C5F02
MRLEDIGREDLDIQKKLYTMHEFIHNMAQLVSSNICHQMENQSSYRLLESIHHLSVCWENMQSVELKRFSCKKLKTFLWPCASGVVIGQQLFSLFEKFTIIRVLDLKNGGITQLPETIVCLKGNHFTSLPETIAMLSCLQTLVLKDCPLLVKFPENFKNLTSLRHLEFAVKGQLSRMPLELGNLVNFQTLYMFIVQVGEGYGIEELKNMKNHGGSLCITKLENVENKVVAEKAFLKNLSWNGEMLAIGICNVRS